MDPTYKLFIKDLINFEKSGDDWLYNFDVTSPKITVNQFHIQGTINKIVGEQKDIILVNDGTGNAKISGVNGAPGDLSWMKEGVYCSIIGSLIKEGKLPHIQAVKLAKIDDNILREMWTYEVDELKDLMCKKISFDLKTAATIPIS